MPARGCSRLLKFNHMSPVRGYRELLAGVNNSGLCSNEMLAEWEFDSCARSIETCVQEDLIHYAVQIYLCQVKLIEVSCARTRLLVSVRLPELARRIASNYIHERA